MSGIPKDDEASHEPARRWKAGAFFLFLFSLFRPASGSEIAEREKKEKELTDHAFSTPSDRIEEEQEEVE